MAGDQRLELYRALVGAKAPAQEFEFAGLMLLPDEPVLAAMSGLIGQRTARLLLTPRVLVELDLGRQYVADVISLTQVTGWKPGTNWRGAQVDIAASRRMVHLGRIPAGTLEPFLEALHWATSNIPPSGISRACEPVLRICDELVTRLRGSDRWLLVSEDDDVDPAESMVGAELVGLCASVLEADGPSYEQSELMERFLIMFGLLIPTTKQAEDSSQHARGMLVTQFVFIAREERSASSGFADMPPERVAGHEASWGEVVTLVSAAVVEFARLGFEGDRARQVMQAETLGKAMVGKLHAAGVTPSTATSEQRPSAGPTSVDAVESVAAPSMDVPPRGWHDDPLSSTRLRYSDGSAWTDQTAEKEPAPAALVEQAPAAAQLPPAGWYADPEMQGRLRFWDGTAWTSFTADPT